MATLLSQEWIGGRLEKTWVHIGEDGRKKITVETVQDVAPVMEDAKALSQNVNRNSVLRFKAHVTGTQLEEACRIASKVWGITFRDCFSEVMQGKTDRAKGIWRTLTEGRDFAKLQARYWK
jgi:hypothetical protein